MSAIKVTSVNWSRLESLLHDAAVPCGANCTTDPRSQGYSFPGAVVLVGCGGEVLFHKAFGSRSLLPAVTPAEVGTVYDVSSLTKIVVTTSLVMYLVEKGLLDVDRRLSRIFQTFTTHGKERLTVRHLLTHCAGYPATAPFYKRIWKSEHSERLGMMFTQSAADTVYQEIFRSRLENLPGKVSRYSDIGFMLLGHAIEVISGTPLQKLAQREIFRPLEMFSSGFIDMEAVRLNALSPVSESIAPTNECAWRKRILCGEVQDENAWAMGGIAGHAGLFSTAGDLHLFAREMIECYHGRGRLFSKDVLRLFWTRDGAVPGSTWALGWDTPAPKDSSVGRCFSQTAVGHLGFTGCSLWIDPEREVYLILLSNRVHPQLENNLIRELRPKVHDAAMEILGFV